MLIELIVVLILAGLVLWALGQLPVDATIARIIRVVVICAAVLWVLGAVLGRSPLSYLR
jgi:Na+/glutamate symporter